jgi:hypothetical protein
MPCYRKIIYGRKIGHLKKSRKFLQNYLSLIPGHFIRQKRTFHAFEARDSLNLSIFKPPLLADQPIMAFGSWFVLRTLQVTPLFSHIRVQTHFHLQDCSDTLSGELIYSV